MNSKWWSAPISKEFKWDDELKRLGGGLPLSFPWSSHNAPGWGDCGVGGPGWGSTLNGNPMGKPDPGGKSQSILQTVKCLKTVSSDYFRWGAGWHWAPSPKTLFRFDLRAVQQCYFWQFYFPYVFHQNNLKKKFKSQRWFIKKKN